MPNRYYQGPPSDHFDGQRFFHPGLPTTDKPLSDLLRWKLHGKPVPWPKSVPARAGVRPPLHVDGLQITHIGHASLLIQVDGTNLLLDPVWSHRVSPFSRIGPCRHNPPAVALEDLPPIHAVLLSHNHYDHMDLATCKQLAQVHHPYFLTPLGNDTILRAAAPQANAHAGDWWTTFDLPQGLRATIVPAYHWSSRGLGDRRMALWGGFILETRVGVLYCAGDTAYRDGKIFQEIRQRFGPPAVAILPIGAYDPRWFMSSQHTNPEEAIQIARHTGAQQVLGVHWNTFALTDEPYNEPGQRLQQAAQAAGFDPTKVMALHPGDIFAPVPPP
jgi:L-ascorbate metabolism protein UlaG (beta-lactamase superfamily)